jgi:hypothetical protein
LEGEMMMQDEASEITKQIENEIAKAEKAQEVSKANVVYDNNYLDKIIEKQ